MVLAQAWTLCLTRVAFQGRQAHERGLCFNVAFLTPHKREPLVRLEGIGGGRVTLVAGAGDSHLATGPRPAPTISLKKLPQSALGG